MKIQRKLPAEETIRFAFFPVRETDRFGNPTETILWLERYKSFRQPLYFGRFCLWLEYARMRLV